MLCIQSHVLGLGFDLNIPCKDCQVSGPKHSIVEWEAFSLWILATP
jgi:hypothetical protein